MNCIHEPFHSNFFTEFSSVPSEDVKIPSLQCVNWDVIITSQWNVHVRNVSYIRSIVQRALWFVQYATRA